MRKRALSGVLIEKSNLPRKASKIKNKETVPKTDTGGLVEKTKANELEVLKELGKKAAVTSG